MNILMFGWEFPPYNSGGLGIACKGIVEGLIYNGLKVSLVLPYIQNNLPDYCVDATNYPASYAFLKGKKRTNVYMSPYVSQAEYIDILKKQGVDVKGRNLIEEAYIYGARAKSITKDIPHKIIHAHDWLSFVAGMEAKKVSDAPFIAQIHSTEFDRAGGNPNPEVYKIEKQGMEAADMVIAVSKFTKDKIVKHYGIKPEKISVLHNAIYRETIKKHQSFPIKQNDKIVLFLGRITMQKGPDYFLDMAKKVLTKVKNVKFIITGDGDMMEQTIKKSIKLDIQKNVLFTGFLRGEDMERAYQNADVYVMPSVSEPFGLTVLEAIQHGAPVVVSKQSGVSEVVSNVLKVDFWDTDEMANKVISVLKYGHLKNMMTREAANEISKFSWADVGGKLNLLYKTLNYA